MKTTWLALLTCPLPLGSAAVLAGTDEETRGQHPYFDRNLSLNQNQSCADCYLPATGFVNRMNVADPWNTVVSLGSNPMLNGGDNAP